MQRRFYMAGKTLRIELTVDKTHVVNREATEQEIAEHRAAEKRAKKQKK